MPFVEGVTEILPENKIVIFVVYNGRDAPVWVKFRVARCLLLARLEVEVYRLIRQAQYF